MTDRTETTGAIASARILIVDDEPNVLLVLERVLQRAGYEVETASDGEMALERFRRKPADLVLSDLVMPGMDGIELLRAVREIEPGVAFILLTGVSSIQDVAAALELGADHYLRKPFDVEEVRFAVERALRYARIVRENEQLKRARAAAPTAAPAPPAAPAPEAPAGLGVGDALQVIASILDVRAGDPGRHTARVVRLATAVGRRMGLDDGTLRALASAAVVYDVGYFGVPDRILHKRGPLSAEEYEVVKRHTQIGAQILERSAALQRVVPGVLYHHERWDGGGYPEGLAGEEIPQIARVLAVVDTFFAITTDRPYRPRRTARVAVQELRRGAGTQFDPAAVEAILAVIGENGNGDALPHAPLDPSEAHR